MNTKYENLELLPSVGAAINNKTGDVFDIMADNTIDFNDPSNILDMWNDQFNCEEWFNALHTLDRSVVDRVLNNLKWEAEHHKIMLDFGVK